MQGAPIPGNESQRLESLRKLHILDTPPEERFDRITRLATKVFHLPISTITLVDANREWFKSVCGLDQHEGDRAISFCGHAMLADGLLLIPDATQDERFRDNPMVVGEPFIRFYAGVPLFSGEGERIGTFCVKGREPRVMSDEEQETLRALAQWAELEINVHNLSVVFEQVKESVFELDTFFKTTDDFMCIAKTDGYFKRINPAFSRVLGYAESEILKNPFVYFIHPGDVETTNREVQKLAAGAKTVDFINRYRKQDGSYITLQWNATPHGELLYATARDITQKKEQEDMLQRLNKLMVDRELRMIELKKRIKQLEEGLATSNRPVEDAVQRKS